MAKSSDELGGCLFGGLGFAAFIYFVTAPASDQVCRNHKVPVLDAIHGIDGQPTCQQLMDQIDAQAATALRRANELESRLEDVENRLRM